MFYRLATLAVMSFCLCGVMTPAEDSGVWLDVPFVSQQKDGCGAASVAMVMQYWFNLRNCADGKQAGKGACAPSESVDAAISTLSDEELARLASRADKLDQDFAAGRLSDRDLLIVIVGIAALVLIIVAVR